MKKKKQNKIKYFIWKKILDSNLNNSFVFKDLKYLKYLYNKYKFI